MARGTVDGILHRYYFAGTYLGITFSIDFSCSSRAEWGCSLPSGVGLAGWGACGLFDSVDPVRVPTNQHMIIATIQIPPNNVTYLHHHSHAPLAARMLSPASE